MIELPTTPGSVIRGKVTEETFEELTDSVLVLIEVKNWPERGTHLEWVDPLWDESFLPENVVAHEVLFDRGTAAPITEEKQS